METTEQEIVKAVFDAIDMLNQVVGLANSHGFYVDFEAMKFQLMESSFPYYTFSATIYKRMLAGKPDETELFRHP